MNAQRRQFPLTRSLSSTFEQSLFDRLHLLEYAWFSARNMPVKSVFSTLAFTLKAKDLELYQHSYRVQYFASHLGAALGLTEDERMLVELGALFHDIGKLAIRDTILRKPTRLTEQEYAQIQQHPAHGAFILSHLYQLHQLVPMAYAHHERWDGNGYPHGLRQEEIPLSARIVSIADAFEVMISRRTYKAACSPLKAFTELHNCAGTQFDPELVNVFCNAITNDVLQVLQ